MNSIKYLLLSIFSAFLLSGCTAHQVIAPQPEDSSNRDLLQMHVDSSLSFVFENELLPMFRSNHSRIQVECTYESTAAIGRKLNNGLRTDVVITVAQGQMSQLTANSFISSSTVVPIAMNNLALISASDASISEAGFSVLSSVDSIALGDSESVSSGLYAQEILDHTFPAGDADMPVVTYVNSTADIINWVAKGASTVGLCYITDAHASNLVSVVAEPPEEVFNDTVLYYGGICTITQNDEDAKKFMEFISSDEAIRVFERYGFRSPNTITVDV